MWPVLPLNVQDIAETLRRDQGRFSAAPLQNSIRCHGRPMDEQLDLCHTVAADFCQFDNLQYAAHERTAGVIRRAGDLVEDHAAGGGLEQDDVGEGAPGVDSDAK